MKAKDALEQDRRGFLQMAGVATATFTLRGLSSEAQAATEGTGKMRKAYAADSGRINIS